MSRISFTPRRINWRARCHTWALTELTHRHWDRYHTLLNQAKLTGNFIRPQSAARSALMREYHAEFTQLYIDEVARVFAIPEDQRVSRRKQHTRVHPHPQTPRRTTV